MLLQELASYLWHFSVRGARDTSQSASPTFQEKNRRLDGGISARMVGLAGVQSRSEHADR
jgi:hypothetical protein